MNISYNWLKEYLSFDLEPEKVSEILTSIGLEVESMESVEEIPGGLEGVVVAEVVECELHPDSDHLHITKVDAGDGELLQVVCGAPNVAKGQKVLLATIGTKLPTADGSEFKIKKSKIRGVESMGMICAEDELSIGTSHDGIMVLDSSAKVGCSAKEYLKFGYDTLFSIGLTPNRVDAASHIGVARDLAAYLKFNNIPGDLTLPSVEAFKEGEGVSVPLKVESPEAAPRYLGITVSDVKVEASPDWLQKKLTSIGVRPINNVVDITNYILHETGQPLHAFDVAKIKGREVVVRMSKPNYPFVTLDEVERRLSEEDTVICSSEDPMCIAGVFGGLESGITEATTSVFIESAYFDPVHIRKTSKRHGLKTDASFRFERGADPDMIPYAAKRAALLMQEIAGAKVVGQIREFYPTKIEKKKIRLDFKRMELLMGKAIGAEAILSIIKYLDFEILSSDSEGAEVLAPSYKVDVYRECDVVEEVLRIYGYNNIELPAHVKVSINSTPRPDPELVKSKASDLLAGNGFMECMSNSLTKSDYYSHLKTYPSERLVMILNPLSADLNSMRQTLLFSGLEAIAYNINRQITELKLFEMGNVYSFLPKEGVEDPKNDLSTYREEMRLSLFISGKGTQYWRNNSGEGNYFLLKGYLELLLKRFGVDLYNLEYNVAPRDLFTEGLEYKINGKTLAVMGSVASARLKQFGIKIPVYAAEISWDLLLSLYKKNKIKYSEMPRFPEVRRDLALIIDENVLYSQIRKAALATEKKILKHVALFDVYRGDKIPPGKKQYAVSFVLQDLEKTLTDQYVEMVMQRLLNTFIQQFNASLR